MYSKDTYRIQEIDMDMQDIEVIDNINAQEAFSFLNLATAIYSPNVLKVSLVKQEDLRFRQCGIDPLSVARNNLSSSTIHRTAENEALGFVLYTSENSTNYINTVTFDNEKAEWVFDRKEFDYRLEINKSLKIISPETLSDIRDNLIPMLDSSISLPLKDIKLFFTVADFFKSLKGNTDRVYSIYEKINNLISLKMQKRQIASNEWKEYTQILEKSYFTLASDYYTLGYENNKTDDIMLEKAFNNLQKLIILSPNYGEAVKLASRMFILLQKSWEGKKIALTDTTILGNDVIKNLLEKCSYENFKSLAKAMGVQYQHGFNDGKMFAQSKEGLQKTGMFPSPPSIHGETIVTSPTYKYG